MSQKVIPPESVLLDGTFPDIYGLRKGCCVGVADRNYAFLILLNFENRDWNLSDGFKGMLTAIRGKVKSINDVYDQSVANNDTVWLDAFKAFREENGLPMGKITFVYYTMCAHACRAAEKPEFEGNTEILQCNLYLNISGLDQTNLGQNDSWTFNESYLGNTNNYRTFTYERGDLIYSGYLSMTDDLENNYCFTFRNDVNCIVNPQTAIAPPYCSQIASTSADGNNCNFWFQSLNSTVQDAHIQNLCTYFPGTSECLCNRRALSPIYQLAAQDPITSTVPDGCWWQPCKHDDRAIWVTSKDRAKPGDCPTSLCININDFENLSDSELAQIEQNVSCAKYEDPTSGGGGGGGDGSPTDTFKKFLPYILIGAGVIGIILVIVAIVIGARRMNFTKPPSARKK